MRFPVVAGLADILRVAIAVAVQIGHFKGVSPDTAHHFIDVLTEVGHIENPASVFQVGITLGLL